MQYQKGSWSRRALHLSGIAGKQTEKVHQDVTLLILIHSQPHKVNWPNCISAATCKTKLLKSESTASGLQLANAHGVMNAPKASRQCTSRLQLHQCKIQPMAAASCPLDVHCIRKPVCDCHNLDVAVALSAHGYADMMQR